LTLRRARLTPERLAGLRTQGYTPALIQGAGDAERQVVIKIPRHCGYANEQVVVNGIEADFNLKFGGSGPSMSASKALPMAGFTLHKPGKKGLVTVVLEAIGQLCRQTFDRIAMLRRKLDQAQEDEVRVRQRELERALLAKKRVQFEIDTQSPSQDQVDDAAALATGEKTQKVRHLRHFQRLGRA